MTKPAEQPGPDSCLVYRASSDCAATADAAARAGAQMIVPAMPVELGGQVVTPPHESPFGRLGLFVDSTGALFKLVER